MARPNFSNIDEYISQFPAEVQLKLQSLRSFIHKHAPEATEAISYQIPTFKLNGNLIYFAAFKNHISLYPFPSGVKEFEQAESQYKTSKGTIQFPLDQEIPFELVLKVLNYRLAQNSKKALKSLS